MPLEIERRWLLLDGEPDLSSPRAKDMSHFRDIFQFYLQTESGTLRLRRAGQEYFMTVKGEKVGASAPEWEVPTEQWVFEKLYSSRIGYTQKTRTEVRIDGEVYELDIFSSPAGLVIVELELHLPQDNPNLADFLEEEFMTLVLPECFGRNIEITTDKRYSNFSLALHGLPEGFHKLATT